MSKYKDEIKKLPRVTLDAISEVCRRMLPNAYYKEHPWLLPYGDKNYAKIFDQEARNAFNILLLFTNFNDSVCILRH